MENWNVGMLKDPKGPLRKAKTQHSTIPVFHHSNLYLPPSTLDPKVTLWNLPCQREHWA